MLPPIGTLLLGASGPQPTVTNNGGAQPIQSFDDELLTHQQVAGEQITSERVVDHTIEQDAPEGLTLQPDAESQASWNNLDPSNTAVALEVRALSDQTSNLHLPSALPVNGNRLPLSTPSVHSALEQSIPLVDRLQHDDPGAILEVAPPVADTLVVANQEASLLARFQNLEMADGRDAATATQLPLTPDSSYQELELDLPIVSTPSPAQASPEHVQNPSANGTPDPTRMAQLALLANRAGIGTGGEETSSVTVTPKQPNASVAASKDPGTNVSGVKVEAGNMIPGLLSPETSRASLTAGQPHSQVQVELAIQNRAAYPSGQLETNVQSVAASKINNPPELSAPLTVARNLSEASAMAAGPAASTAMAGMLSQEGRGPRGLSSVETLQARYASRLEFGPQPIAQAPIASQLAPVQRDLSLPSIPNPTEGNLNGILLSESGVSSTVTANPLVGSANAIAGLSRGVGAEPTIPNGLVSAAQTNRLDVADGVNGAWVGRLSHMIAQQQLTGQSLRIALSPAELGAVEITFNGSTDNWSVSLSAQQGQTRELLETHLDRIRSMLQDMGHRDAQVSLANRWTGAETGANQQQSQDAQGGASQSGSWQHSPAVVAEDPASSGRGPTSGHRSTAHGVDAYA